MNKGSIPEATEPQEPLRHSSNSKTQSAKVDLLIRDISNLRELREILDKRISTNENEPRDDTLPWRLAEAAGKATNAYQRHGSPMSVKSNNMWRTGVDPVRYLMLIDNPESGLSFDTLRTNLGVAIGMAESSLENALASEANTNALRQRNYHSKGLEAKTSGFSKKIWGFVGAVAAAIVAGVIVVFIEHSNF